MKNYQAIARDLIFYSRCKQYGDTDGIDKWKSELSTYDLPHGSGIDGETKIDIDASTPERIVITLEYHHMVDGYYDGWSDYSVIITPSLAYNYTLRITGRNRDDIKDYLYQVYSNWLDEEVG